MHSIILSARIFCLTLFTVLPTLLVSAYAQEQGQELSQGSTVRIVRLQYRDADKVRQAISPMLVQGGSIGQMDNALIIATTRQNLAALQGLIAELDIPRRNLVVAVDFNYQSNPAGTLSTATDDQGSQTTLSTRQPEIQRIRLLEGEQALLEQATGTVSTGSSLLNPGLQLTQTTDTNRQQFRVSAEMHGQEVILSIETLQTDNFSGNQASRQRTATRIVTRPGEWVVINPAPEPEVSNQDNALSALLTTRQQPEQIAINVELQP